MSVSSAWISSRKDCRAPAGVSDSGCTVAAGMKAGIGRGCRGAFAGVVIRPAWSQRRRATLILRNVRQGAARRDARAAHAGSGLRRSLDPAQSTAPQPADGEEIEPSFPEGPEESRIDAVRFTAPLTHGTPSLN